MTDETRTFELEGVAVRSDYARPDSTRSGRVVQDVPGFPERSGRPEFFPAEDAGWGRGAADPSEPPAHSAGPRGP
ncbi:MAG TPA: hypothetical protein VIR33_08660, partial [Thermopolyspora sp.]